MMNCTAKCDLLLMCKLLMVMLLFSCLACMLIKKEIISVTGITTVYGSCTHGEVRLVNGVTTNQGRVEVCVYRTDMRNCV